MELSPWSGTWLFRNLVVPELLFCSFKQATLLDYMNEPISYVKQYCMKKKTQAKTFPISLPWIHLEYLPFNM